MPLIDEEGLKRLLKNEISEHIFLLFGDDAYLKEGYAERLEKAVLGDETLRFFNFHSYEDDTTSLEEIFSDAETLPVMAERTLLRVKNYPLNALGEKDMKALEELLKNAPPHAVLLFTYPTVDFTCQKRDYPKWVPVIDLFKKYGTAAECSHRTGRKLAQMLIRGAADRGTSIGESEAVYMIESCGDDMTNLLNEFNKLCAYADGRPVTKEMIDETVTKTVEASVFDISASIFSGDADRAFAIAGELLRQKTPVQSVLGALDQAYMTIYRYKVALAANRTVQDLMTDMGYKNDQSYTFKKIAGFASKTSMKTVRTAIDVLSEADIKSKSTATPPETLLTEVIARLSAL